VGIDIAPAAIDYARAQAVDLDPAPRYVLADVTAADFGGGPFDLVMMVHGEFNTFARPEVEATLRRARSVLNQGGQMLIEAHPGAAVERIGRRPRAWMPAQRGLFQDHPYVRLDESDWDGTTGRAINLHWIIDAATLAVERFGTVTHAYSDAEFERLILGAGFTGVETFPSLGGEATDPNLFVLVASV
jgi:SAM-dependent methyltransferase